MTKIKDIYGIDINWIDEKIYEHTQSIIKLRYKGDTAANRVADILCNERDAYIEIKKKLKPIQPIIQSVMDSVNDEQLNEMKMRNEHGSAKGVAFEVYINNQEYQL